MLYVRQRFTLLGRYLLLAFCSICFAVEFIDRGHCVCDGHNAMFGRQMSGTSLSDSRGSFNVLLQVFSDRMDGLIERGCFIASGGKAIMILK